MSRQLERRAVLAAWGLVAASSVALTEGGPVGWTLATLCVLLAPTCRADATGR